MLGARLCNVVGDRPLVVLLADIQDWGIAICCCTKFVQKIICVFFFLFGFSTCKMYSDLYDGIHPITRWGTLTKAIEIDMETETLEHSIIGYQTEDGFKFYFNQFGELTDGDITFESREELTAAQIGLILDPIFPPNWEDE